MKIYKDETLIQEIGVLDLGIVPAGETKDFKFWVVNDTRAFLRELKFS